MSEPVIEGGPTDADLDEVFEGHDDSEGEQQPQKVEAKVPEPKPEAKVPQSLTKEDFLAGIKELAPKPQQRQLSPDELNKLLNVWNPDEKFINAFFNPEATPQDRLQMFTALRDGLIAQALTGMRHMLDHHQAQFEPRFSAFEGFVQDRRREEMRNEFLKLYPGLNKYQKLMGFISSQVEQTGYQAPDVETGYKYLADEATKFIKENIDPEFDPAGVDEFGAGTTNQQQSANGMPRMVANSSRGAQGVAKPTSSGKKQTGPDGGLWDED
jgi:hypothetical protein